MKSLQKSSQEEPKEIVLAKTTGVQFLKDLSPGRALSVLKDVRSVPDVWRAKTPSLAALKNHYGEDFPVDYMALWLIQINDMLNLTNKMSGAQIDITARLIFNENPMLTIADIKVVFDRAVSGSFGEIYNRLDSAIVCKWFRDYWDERLNTAADHSIEQHRSRMTQEQSERRR